MIAVLRCRVSTADVLYRFDIVYIDLRLWGLSHILYIETISMKVFQKNCVTSVRQYVFYHQQYTGETERSLPQIKLYIT